MALEPGSSRRHSEASAARGSRLVQQLQNGRRRRRRRREAQARPGGAAGTATEAVRAPRALRARAGAPRRCTSLFSRDRGAPAECARSGAALPQFCGVWGQRSSALASPALPRRGSWGQLKTTNGSLIQPAGLTGDLAQARRRARVPDESRGPCPLGEPPASGGGAPAQITCRRNVFVGIVTKTYRACCGNVERES